MPFELWKQDSILNFLIEANGERQLSTSVAQPARLSQESVIRWAEGLIKDDFYVGKMIFIKEIQNNDFSTHEIWLPIEYHNQAKSFLEKGGFATYYDQKHKEAKEKKEREELQREQMKKSIEFSNVSMQRSKIALIISGIAIAVSIAAVIVNKL